MVESPQRTHSLWRLDLREVFQNTRINKKIKIKAVKLKNNKRQTETIVKGKIAARPFIPLPIRDKYTGSIGCYLTIASLCG
jgi:hypothetical protein